MAQMLEQTIVYALITDFFSKHSFCFISCSIFSNEKAFINAWMRLWLHATVGKKRQPEKDKDEWRCHDLLMNCFDSIITINRVLTCRSSSLHNYTLTVSNTSCQEMDSFQGWTIGATERQMGLFSGNKSEDSSATLCWCSMMTAWEDQGSLKLLSLPPHADYTSLYFPPPCGTEDKILLPCSSSLDFPMSLTGTVAPSLFSTSKETRGKRGEQERGGAMEVIDTGRERKHEKGKRQRGSSTGTQKRSGRRNMTEIRKEERRWTEFECKQLINLPSATPVCLSKKEKHSSRI